MITLFLAAAFAAGPYVEVLGIAQDAGHPQIGCTRTCCAALDGPAHAVSSVAIVDPESGQHWVLDATPDLPRQLRGLPGELGGILLTHAHIGHYTGLMYLGREALGADGVPVYAMPRMTSFLQENGPWSQLVELGNVRLEPLKDRKPTVLTQDLSVTPMIVPHRDEFSETVGFVIVGPKRRVLYLPDIDKWERWKRPIEAVLRTVDVAYVDGTFYDGAELPGRDMDQIPHPFLVESIARFEGLPAKTRKKVRFLHLNHTNPALDPESDAAQAVRAAGMAIAAEGETTPL